MIITIIGASGFLGQHLVKHLLKTTDYQIRVFCRSADSLPFVSDPRVTPVAGNIFDEQALQAALQEADAAVYLVHMMGDKHRDFYADEARAAATFSKAAKACGVKRVVYMSGLGNDSQHLSKHLASRHNSGRIMAETLPSVIELRASMIIGKGSVAYDIIRAIATRLPVLAVPRWAVTLTQPITLHDALEYIIASLTLTSEGHQIIDIGGPERLTYPQILARYAISRGHKSRVFVVPYVPQWAAVLWLKQFLPHKASDIGQPMIASLSNQMVVENNSAQTLFPHIQPQPIELGFNAAI